jgi:retron-type reverse transcriptase
MNNMNNTTNNNLKNWGEIEKVKWKDFKRNPAFERMLNTATFSYSPKIRALQGIFERTTSHYKNTEKPLENILTHKNLFDLTISKDLIRISYNKLKNNKGAMTPGTSQSTADGMSEELIQQLHDELKNGTFKWTPVKRIDIQKPGRAKGVTRPLGLPDFRDKLVQNNITHILNCIYEPEFQYLNCNFGFRPKVGCNHAIKQIRMYTNGMDVAIEGDIIGAYDNVQHNILIKILRKRIKDEKLLKLIYDALKIGHMKDNMYYDSFLGTPQGGIHSPILFNIYMNEFDKYIILELPKILDKWNSKINPNETNNPLEKYTKRIVRNNKKINTIESNIDPEKIMEIYMSYKDRIEIFKEIKHLIPDCREKNNTIKNIDLMETSQPTPEELEIFSNYEKIRKKDRSLTIDKFKESEQIIIRGMNARVATDGRIHRNIKKLIEDNKLFKEAYESYIRTLRKKSNQNKQEQLKLKPIDPEKKQTDYRYYRYADDWILFTRGTLSKAKTIKKVLEKWLNNNLKLQLSPDKTLITNIRENKAHFLGFEIFHQINKQIVRRNAQTGTFLQRYGKIQIMPNTERLEKQFRLKNYLNKNDKILSVGFLTPLEDHQIIQKFNEFIMGLGLFYITEISRPSALNRWHYILYYSCLKTLAHKHKSSIKKIVSAGYKDISDPNIYKVRKTNVFQNRIVRSYTMKDGTKKYVTLLNYHEMMMKLLSTRKKFRDNNPLATFNSPTIDFLRVHKNNWRTKFKLQSMCSICSSTEKLELHHIKAIRKSKSKGKVFNKFDQMVGSLGRKQICLCRTCHNKVTHGEYSGIALKDLIDVRIVAPESFLRKDDKTKPPIKTINIKNSTQITISEIDKTYFNLELNNYHKSKTIHEIDKDNE